MKEMSKILMGKYFSLLRKFIGNICRKRIGLPKKLTKLFKIFYLFFGLIIELVGDVLFFWKRFKKVKIINPQKILIIKFDQLGDVLLSTSLLPLIKNKWPELKIDYLINPKVEVVIKNNPQLNKIYFWNNLILYFVLGRKEAAKKPKLRDVVRKNLALLKFLRHENYDVIINLRAYPPSSNFVWKLIKPKNLLAFDISGCSFLADYWAPYNLQEEEWRNYLRLLEPLGIKADEAKFSSGFFNFDDRGIEEKMPAVFGAKKIVALAPVSFDRDRLWPIKNWQRVVINLLQLNYQVVLTGLPSQEKFLSDIVSELDQRNIRIATNLSISELGSLLKKSDFFIGIDSFPAHLSLALFKKTFCLVNTKSYYLKGYSRPKIFIDGRSMIPLVENIKILPLESSAAELIKLLNFAEK